MRPRRKGKALAAGHRVGDLAAFAMCGEGGDAQLAAGDAEVVAVALPAEPRDGKLDAGAVVDVDHVALGMATRGGVADELARLDVLLMDDWVDLPALAGYLKALRSIKWAQTSALLLPDPDDLPGWLRVDDSA